MSVQARLQWPTWLPIGNFHRTRPNNSFFFLLLFIVSFFYSIVANFSCYWSVHRCHCYVIIGVTSLVVMSLGRMTCFQPPLKCRGSCCSACGSESGTRACVLVGWLVCRTVLSLYTPATKKWYTFSFSLFLSV